MENSVQYSQLIKQKARELDFLDCGIARAESLENDKERLKTWLEKGFHGNMDYMANHFEKRVDPRELVDGARSLIIVLQNYYADAMQSDPQAPVVSKYAFGKDYHKIIRKKLKIMLSWMQTEFGEVSGRVFVDSAPVMERAWGRLAGLGWIGKHSLLLNRKYGSFFFIGVIVTDMDLLPDKPMNEYCGDCTRCIDACPTNAILPGRTIDASRCISYLTIELKDDFIPEQFRQQMENRVFGCDICQDVCPWNKNSHNHSEPGLSPRPGLLEMTRDDWMNLKEEHFNQVFEGSALKRTKFTGLKRNIDFLKESNY